jgi:hypothetical protein
MEDVLIYEVHDWGYEGINLYPVSHSEPSTAVVLQNERVPRSIVEYGV